ncbi:MAG TPA: porin family protein [Sphingobium sp.]
MKKILASALLLASVSAPAFAQDAVPFSGPYVGAVVGLDHVDFDSQTHDSGLLYGGVVGYDINVNGAVFGLEGEYADSDVKESATDVVVSGDSLSVRTSRDLYAGVRIGGQIAQNVLVYAKGGYTNARFKATYDDGVVVDSDSLKLDGYRLGAGVETTFQGFTARAEYRYSRYESLGTVNPERHQAALILGYRF